MNLNDKYSNNYSHFQYKFQSSYSPSLKPSYGTSYNGGQSSFGYTSPTYPVFSKPASSYGSSAYGGYSPSQPRPIYSSSSGGSSYGVRTVIIQLRKSFHYSLLSFTIIAVIQTDLPSANLSILPTLLLLWTW